MLVFFVCVNGSACGISLRCRSSFPCAVVQHGVLQ
uniref:Uncharacterized protein n=1 Tax=Anguilla anguilla TaxID=7936 RepID=A0A0E9PQW3_ANGAN